MVLDKTGCDGDRGIKLTQIVKPLLYWETQSPSKSSPTAGVSLAKCEQHLLWCLHYAVEGDVQDLVYSQRTMTRVGWSIAADSMRKTLGWVCS